MLDRINDGVTSLGAMLELRARRHETISSNLANSDTPNYKAVDFNFGESLSRAIGVSRKLDGVSKMESLPLLQVGLDKTHQAHFGYVPDLVNGSIQRKFTVPHQSSLDGNTVETSVEQAKFAENIVKYEAALKAINSHIETMRLAMDAPRR